MAYQKRPTAPGTPPDLTAGPPGIVPRGTYQKVNRPQGAYNPYEDPDWVQDNLSTPDPSPQRFLVPGTPSMPDLPGFDPDSPAGQRVYKKLLQKLEKGTE